jgi:hypothetical protein
MRWVILFGGLTLAAIGLTYTQPLEFWLLIWQIIAVPLAVVVLGVIWLAAKKQIASESFASIMVGLTIMNLAAYASPFLATIDSLSPISVVQTIPRSHAVLQITKSPERVYTDLSVYPSCQHCGSLFPNVAMVYDQQSAQAYLSFLRTPRGVLTMLRQLCWTC